MITTFTDMLLGVACPLSRVTAFRGPKSWKSAKRNSCGGCCRRPSNHEPPVDVHCKTPPCGLFCGSFGGSLTQTRATESELGSLKAA